MNDFLGVMSAIWNLFSTPLDLYGFSFSFRNIFFFTIIVGVVFRFIKGVIFDD